MSKLRTRVLLRECVKAILSEDDGGFGGGMMGIGGGGDLGYGMHFGSGEDMYKIFVKPFVDVVQVTAGKSKEASQKLQTLLHVAFETIATTLIPVLSSDYKEIFAKEEERINKIKGEYTDVYKATRDAFKNHDFLCSAFFYNPTAFLTTAFVEHAPAAALNMMSVLSGGTIDKELMGIKKQFSGGGGKKHEAVMREDEEGQPSKLSQFSQALTSKELMGKLSQSPVVQKMEHEGMQAVRQTLSDVYKHAKGVLSARSLEDLQKVAKKPIPGMDKLAQIPQEARQGSEQQILKGVKDSMKSFYVKSLEAQVKQYVDAGTPANHPYVADYQKVINKIKAL